MEPGRRVERHRGHARDACLREPREHGLQGLLRGGRAEVRHLAGVAAALDERHVELLLPLAGADVYAKTPADKRAEEAILRIRTLRERLFELAKLPRTLSETGKVERSQLAAIAKLALDDGSILMNPVEVSYKDALAVLEKAF